MHRINVGPLHGLGKEYDSPSAAIHGAQRDNASWLSKTGAAGLFGQQIDAAWWTDERVLIRLVSGSAVLICCDKCGVICDVAGPGSFPSNPDAAPENIPGEVELRFRSVTTTWDGASLLRRLPGRRLTRLYVSGSELYLYASNLPIYCFSTLENLDTGNLFLYWCESE
jgi:hypothetical protein